MDRLREAVEAIALLFGGKGPAVVREYHRAFKANPLALEEFAAWAGVGQAKPLDRDELNRAIGREEAFWHVADALRLEPAQVDKLVRGEPYDA